MEKSNLSTHEKLEQESECLRTPSKVLQALRKALLDSKNENAQLAREVTALKEQLASKENSWERKHNELLKEKEVLAETLFQAQQLLDKRSRDMDITLGHKEEEIRSLKSRNHLQRQEIHNIIKHWTTEYDLVTKFWNREYTNVSEDYENKIAQLRRSFDQRLTESQSEWERQFACQEKRLESLQKDLETKLHEVTLDRDDLITVIKETKKSLFDSAAKASHKELALKKNDVEWRAKCDALQEQLTAQQTRSKEMHQEMVDEWCRKERKMEEEIQLLTQRNAELQELASKTDKEKKKMKKEEEKAQKETEKRLKKEKKEEEARAKREKNEHDRKEKERLKKEKKEQKEQEEREKKEKKEHERKEKERLKAEKKDKEKREKKEKKERKERAASSSLTS